MTLKIFVRVFLSIIGGLVFGAIAITFSLAFFLPHNNFMNIMMTFATTIMIAPLLCGAQSVGAAIICALISQASVFRRLVFLPASIASFIIGFALQHDTIAKPKFDVFSYVLYAPPVFIGWNLAIGVGCWLTWRYFEKRSSL